MTADPDATKSIYESGEYLARNPMWHAEESPWKAGQLLRMLERNDLRPRSICEIGCGAGEVLVQLQARLGTEVELRGYDISPQAMQLCSPKANASLQFELAGTEHIRDDGFDLALVLDVIEHVDDYIGFLHEVRAKGRQTIFHIPLDISVQTVARGDGLDYVRDAYGHVHYFTRQTALRTLEDAGYRVSDWFYTPRAIDEPATELRRRVMKWPRRLLFSISEEVTARVLGGISLMVLTTAGDR